VWMLWSSSACCAMGEKRGILMFMSQLEKNKYRPFKVTVLNFKVLYKGKAIPLQAWTGPEGPRKLRLPDFKTVGT